MSLWLGDGDSKPQVFKVSYWPVGRAFSIKLIEKLLLWVAPITHIPQFGFGQILIILRTRSEAFKQALNVGTGGEGDAIS